MQYLIEVHMQRASSSRAREHSDRHKQGAVAIWRLLYVSHFKHSPCSRSAVLQVRVVVYVAAMQTLRSVLRRLAPRDAQPKRVGKVPMLLTYVADAPRFPLAKYCNSSNCLKYGTPLLALWLALSCNIRTCQHVLNVDLQVHTQSLCSTTCLAKGKKLKTRKVFCRADNSWCICPCDQLQVFIAWPCFRQHPKDSR